MATLPSYPFPPATMLDPPTELAALRDGEPISRIEYAGAPAWLLTRHGDIRAAMSDNRLVPYIPGIPAGEEVADGGIIFLMSGTRHTRLRRLVSGAFGTRRIAMLRPAAQRLADERLAALTTSGPPADLAGDYAAPLAIGVLSELLGTAIADRDGFATWSTDVTALFGTPSAEELMHRSGERLNTFLIELVAAKRSDPGPDLISALIEARDPDGERLTDAEVHGVVFSMLAAGYVPPVQAITLAMLRLLLDPAAADSLRNDLDLLPTAVDELLRLDPGGAGNVDRAMRASADVDLGGVLIRCGDVVVAPLGTANRDPARFPAPDDLVLNRSDNPHLSFAPGPHHCLGAALARLELEIGIGTLLVGLPTLALAADPDELTWRTGLAGDRNLVALPVTW